MYMKEAVLGSEADLSVIPKVFRNAKCPGIRVPETASEGVRARSAVDRASFQEKAHMRRPFKAQECATVAGWTGVGVRTAILGSVSDLVVIWRCPQGLFITYTTSGKLYKMKEAWTDSQRAINLGGKPTKNPKDPNALVKLLPTRSMPYSVQDCIMGNFIMHKRRLDPSIKSS
jgi:hypothetical protein